MDPSSDQILQKAIAAHKAGKFQDAEGLYKAILQSQPLHPDANHNLGVLAVSVGKVNESLPLFKAAIEANPKIEQFWLSYIDALIKTEMLEKAMRVVKLAKRSGLGGDKLKALERQLLLRSKSTDPEGPPEQHLRSLLDDYQRGRFNEAEKLAIDLTKSFPKHAFAWKILGAIYKQTGKTSEAVKYNKAAVKLNPEDAESHSNLGVTLKELGQLRQAEQSYMRALTIKPEYFKAYSNLGVTLHELGKLKDAQSTYGAALCVMPLFPEAHNNLGNTLKQLGRLEEAEASYKQAIALKPDYVEAHSKLGDTLQELGRLDEAEASCRQAITLKPDFALAHYGLSKIFYIMGNEDLALKSIMQANAIESKSKEYKLFLW